MDILLNWLWQGTFIAVATGLALRVSRRISATIRCYVLWLALLLILFLPSGLLPPLTSDQETSAAGAVAVGDDAGAGLAMAIEPASPGVSLVLAGVAACWSALFAGQATLALAGLYRLKRRCQPFPVATEACLSHWLVVKHVGRRARLAISSDVSSAAVLGMSSPVIAVAPALLARLSHEDLDRIVIHEWAHVQRRDDLLNLLQIVARAAVGWHPGVWWIDRRLHSEREAACDERTIRVTGSPRAYAACLARLAELRGSTSAVLLAPGAANASALTERVERVLARKTLPSIVASLIIGMPVIVLLILFAGLLASVSLFAIRPSSDLAAAAASVGNAVATALKPIASDDAPAAKASAVTRRPAAQHRAVGSTRDVVRSTVTTGASTPLAIPVHSANDPVALPPEPDIRQAPPIPESGSLTVLSTAPGVTLPHPDSSIDSSNQRETTPWGVATDTGVAVARGSHRAAVATAGFFNRLGKKIAKSF